MRMDWPWRVFGQAGCAALMLAFSSGCKATTVASDGAAAPVLQSEVAVSSTPELKTEVIVTDAASRVLKAYADRLPGLREQMPQITRTAEMAAERRIRASSNQISVFREPDHGLGYELTSRAGGMVGIHHRSGRWRTPSSKRRSTSSPSVSNEVILVSVPEWGQVNETTDLALKGYSENGALVVVFGPRVGMPTNYPNIFLVDNGSPSGITNISSLNVLANTTLGWAWCCEYVAALTRQGKRPGVLKSIGYPDGRAFNEPLKQNSRTLYDESTPVPAEKLGNLYMDRVEKLVQDVSAEPVHSRLRQAADLVAGRLKEGKQVFTATCNHLLQIDIYRDVQSGIQPFRPYDGGFKKTLKEGDLLVWFGYIGMNTANYQHGASILETKADFITCFAPGVEGMEEVPEALLILPQSWEFGDAEVPVPFLPGKMAPVSGLNQTLLYRMLDAAVVERLQPAE